ncbi:hypothetical protein FRB91_002280 [Serendipita sp. 411]|nr:hypothetical protein FRB91_002280 [Serendipita sp. 411]
MRQGKLTRLKNHIVPHGRNPNWLGPDILHPLIQMLENRQTDLRDSVEFPSGPGYDDIRLISSDRIVFNFHRWPLMYMSPVFRDMFEIGNPGGSGGGSDNNSQSVTLSEDSGTLSLMLQFIDPKKENPPLDFTILPKFLEAGRKYQIDETNEWVTRWLNGSGPIATSAKFNTQQAIELLEAGTTFDVPRLSQLALRVLIRAPSHELFVPSLTGSKLFGHLMKLRMERIDWFRRALTGFLSDKSAVNLRYVGNTTVRILDRSYRDDGAYRNLCIAILNIMHAVSLEPSHAFCTRSWSNDLDSIDYPAEVQNKKKALQENCQSLELELPILP